MPDFPIAGQCLDIGAEPDIEAENRTVVITFGRGAIKFTIRALNQGLTRRISIGAVRQRAETVEGRKLTLGTDRKNRPATFVEAIIRIVRPAFPRGSVEAAIRALHQSSRRGVAVGAAGLTAETME